LLQLLPDVEDQDGNDDAGDVDWSAASDDYLSRRLDGETNEDTGPWDETVDVTPYEGGGAYSKDSNQGKQSNHKTEISGSRAEMHLE
jgi:hypothetical protein